MTPAGERKHFQLHLIYIHIFFFRVYETLLSGQDNSDNSAGKESACNTGDTGDAGSIPGVGRSPGEGNVNRLQYSCLENPVDRGAWHAIHTHIIGNHTA